MTDDAVPPLHVRVMGVTVAIEAPDEPTRERLAHQWSRAVVAPDDGPAQRAVTARDAAPGLTDSRDYTVTTDVTLAALVVTAGERFNLHAGGVADEDGRVLALVGPSGTGKTTATRTLAQRLAYVSDETVSVEMDGTVHPHAKPLSVLADTDTSGPKRQHSPDELGLLPTPALARLGRLVVLRRGRPGARGLSRLEPVDGLLELIAQSSSLGDVPSPLSSLHRLVQSVGGVWLLEYDEIEDHVDALVDLLGEDLPPLPQHDTVRYAGTRDAGDTARVGVPPGRVARTAWVDALELDGDLLVLRPGRAARLENLMATTWIHLDEPRTLTQLVELARADHGDHPDAEGIVGRAVDLLVEEGLAVRGPGV